MVSLVFVGQSTQRQAIHRSPTPHLVPPIPNKPYMWKLNIMKEKEQLLDFFVHCWTPSPTPLCSFLYEVSIGCTNPKMFLIHNSSRHWQVTEIRPVRRQAGRQCAAPTWWSHGPHELQVNQLDGSGVLEVIPVPVIQPLAQQLDGGLSTEGLAHGHVQVIHKGNLVAQRQNTINVARKRHCFVGDKYSTLT